MGELRTIWRKRGKRGPMDPVDVARLVEGAGMEDDANNSRTRQVTLVAEEAWADAVAQVGQSVDPIARRANFLIRGIDLRDTRHRVLAIGDCRVRIHGETVPCERMEEAATGLRDALKPDWRGGAFGKVVRGGTVRVGDPVRWVDDVSS